MENEKFEFLPWMELYLDDREISELRFCVTYGIDFHHGTDGHNMRMLIYTLYKILRELHYGIGGPFIELSAAEGKRILGQTKGDK